MHPSPSGCWAEAWEVLTAIIGQRASILQCLDRPIENALGAVKLVKIGGKIGEGIIGFWPLTNWNDCAKFHQILFKIATVGAMTDTQTDRRRRSYYLFHAMQ